MQGLLVGMAFELYTGRFPTDTFFSTWFPRLSFQQEKHSKTREDKDLQNNQTLTSSIPTCQQVSLATFGDIDDGRYDHQLNKTPRTNSWATHPGIEHTLRLYESTLQRNQQFPATFTPIGNTTGQPAILARTDGEQPIRSSRHAYLLCESTTRST